KRIVGGTNAVPHSHPWQISLRSTINGVTDHICGGVILNSTWVLTAAHCVDGIRELDLHITAGGHFLQTPSEHQVTSNVLQKFMHPSYDPNFTGYPNDLALLRLETAVLENVGIKYGSLPVDDTNDFIVNNGCYITGWGDTEGSGQHSNALQVGSTNVVSNPDCISAHGLTGTFGIRETNICFGLSLSTSCNGDSGGPAVCNVTDTMYVVGIDSWRRTGCPTDYPSIYTRVSKYIDWILNTINAN
ncbi:hypothetical protein LOTGIDRAFT_108162, partial [Lottia gigantea]